MDFILSGIAFALMLAAQFLSVVVAHNARCKGTASVDSGGDAHTRHIWLLGA
jgi:hypothetical protein